MKNIPLVLAGPILRRTEESEVVIWLATSQKLPARAEVYGPSEAGVPAAIGQNSPESRTVRLGERLFVTLLRVVPSKQGEKFPADTVLQYDIFVEHDGKEIDLRELNAMGEGVGDIFYSGLDMPSFVIPSKMRKFVHCSCRKPHGKGFDSLVIADRVIEEFLQRPAERPTTLFMTGDQIYADDVAASLITRLSALGQALMGGDENIPGLNVSPGKIGLYRRMHALDEAKAGLTSSHGDNHLITFGEYAAMYLMVWNRALWPTAFEPEYEKIPNDREEEYRDELRRINRFIGSIEAVQRVLANISVYMIFDDHEVTDDWNLNGDWYNNVNNSNNPTGKRVVSNALAAYWAFQGWGNSPESFPAEFIMAIEEHCTDRGEDSGKYDRTMWGFHEWHYSVPYDPAFIVLDGRTRRHFDSGKGAARLLDTEVYKWFREEWDRLTSKGANELVLVAPIPVCGLAPYEWVKKFLYYLKVKPAMYDFESWSANREGFAEFLDFLSRRIGQDRIVILSGDVHYSFSALGQYECGDKKITLKQLTSSASKNSVRETKKGLIRKLEDLLKGVLDYEETQYGCTPEAPGYLKKLPSPLLGLLYRAGLRRYIWRYSVQLATPIGNDKRTVQMATNIGLVHLKGTHEVRHELLTWWDAEDVVKIVFKL